MVQRVNVGNTTERNYRYTMEVPQAKVEGRGNGIKTVITNLETIANELSRPPTYLLKYYGYELGALSKYDRKAEKYIVNGAWDNQQLLEVLKKGFIPSYVLCGACGNPETNIEQKGRKVVLSCQACGNTTPLDPRHKLYAQIEKELKEDRRTKKKKKKQGKSDDTNLSPETVFKEMLATKGENVSDKAVIRFAKELKQSQDLDDTEIVRVISKVMFVENVVDNVVQYVSVLEKFVTESKKAQRVLLRHLEKQAVDDEDLMSKFARVLFHLFEHDVIEENAIVSWFNKTQVKGLSVESVQRVRDAAQPFIEWLNNAEEEEDSEDEQ